MLYATPLLPARPHVDRLLARTGAWYARRATRPGWHRDRPLDRALRAAGRLAARHEIPRSTRLLETLLIGRQSLWTDAGFRECRGVWHGYRLRLDLSDFYQRWAFFLSRYHDVPLQVLLRATLRPGDTFIDGGANNGLISLVAAWLVGPRGCVLAFEPNPVVFDQLTWHIRANHLSQISPLQQGLSDTEEQLALRVPDPGNLAAATFAPPPARYGAGAPVSAAAVTVRTDSLTDLPRRGALAVKLDVEGFETRALRGMIRLLTERRPLVITEINREMLIAAGSSPAELFALMHTHGYRGYGYDTAPAMLRHRCPVLWRVPATGPRLPRDIAWIHPHSEAAARLDRCVASPPPPGAPGAA